MSDAIPLRERGSPRLRLGARVLVIKPKMIGDTLLATPAIRALQRARPDLSLDVVVRAGSEGVLAALGDIGRVIATVPPQDEHRTRVLGAGWRWHRRLREVRYDAACDLTGNERGHYTLLACRARQKLAAPPAANLHHPWLWRYVVPTLAVPRWRTLHAVERDAVVLGALCGEALADLRLEFPTAATAAPVPLPAAYAFVQPGSRVADKTWPEARWQAVIAMLASACGHVVLSSGPDASDVALIRRLAEVAPTATTLNAGAWFWPQLAAVMRGARVFAGSDSVAAHLAAAVGLPAVVVWGPSYEQIWAPWSDRAWLVVDDAIVSASSTRGRLPPPGASRRSTSANRAETVEAALRIALGAEHASRMAPGCPEAVQPGTDRTRGLRVNPS